MIYNDKYFGLSPFIARWKSDTPLENWLSLKADRSDFWKSVYVLYYQITDNKYYKGGLNYIEKAVRPLYGLGDVDKTTFKDMVYCLHRFGISFEDYCLYGFKDNSSLAYRDSFVADKLRYHYCDILNTSAVRPLMEDKYACYRKFCKFFKRDMAGCYSVEDWNIFAEFVSRHSTFIYKPLNEHSGHGITILESEDINPEEFFASKIKNGPFVLEELIVQGKETAMMHPESINSCRVVTFNLQGKIHIIGVTWRIGTGKAIKDNAGSGGIYAAVNPETGVVETDARNYRGNIFEFHPDTNLKFKGYHLPEWSSAKSFINDMALNQEGATLISWDIAYSCKGWLMVEANDNGDWSIIQSNMREGKKKLLYSLMDKYFNSNSGTIKNK